MKMRRLIGMACLVLAGTMAQAQEAGVVIANATRAMGMETLDSLYYYGSGASYSLGQNNNAAIAWPRNNLNDYVRAIDFTQASLRSTWSTYAVPVTGGAAALRGDQQNIAATAQTPWAQQLELWTTPWGFLKGAAANGATMKSQVVAGRKYQVLTWITPLKSPGGQAYRVVGYVSPAGLVERVQTWVEHGIYGDMLVDSEYAQYRDNNGLKYPTRIVQKRGGWPVFDLQVLGAFANPARLKELMTVPTPATAAPAVVAAASPAALVASELLAPGVYRIRAAYNSLAVEFADYIVLFEPGPQNEARAQAGIAETRRLFPGKPIRFGVITHHHFDHTGGIAAVAAEGITIVTPAVNKAFLEQALSEPRTLAPDALARSGRKATVEGFAGDKRVFQDATRTMEIHVIRGLPHADGLVVGWLPKEKILVYADMFNLPPPSDPVPHPQVVGTRVFNENITRLGLDPVQILSIHTLNPDRLATLQDIRGSLGIGN
jgi:glyoxylase-like metal-dependent hydrolase (beta-lactamase superfamily II)